MSIPDKIDVQIGKTRHEFYPNKIRVGGLIAIGTSLAVEAIVATLYFMYSQPGAIEQPLRLGVLKVAAIAVAFPGLLGIWDVISARSHGPLP